MRATRPSARARATGSATPWTRWRPTTSRSAWPCSAASPRCARRHGTRWPGDPAVGWVEATALLADAGGPAWSSTSRPSPRSASAASRSPAPAAAWSWFPGAGRAPAAPRRRGRRRRRVETRAGRPRAGRCAASCATSSTTAGAGRRRARAAAEGFAVVGQSDAASMPTFDASALDYAIIAIYFVTVLGVGFPRAEPHQDGPRLLPVGPLAAGVDHRPGLHCGEPRRPRDPRHGGERRAVRRGDRPLLLDRRRSRPTAFLGLVMMPFYYGSKVRSVPEYLRRRYGNEAHLFNALSFAVATVLIGGVNLFALGTRPVADARLVDQHRRSCCPPRSSLEHHPRRPPTSAIYNEVHPVLRDRGDLVRS